MTLLIRPKFNNYEKLIRVDFDFILNIYLNYKNMFK
jgi:hypothetical protein